MALFSQWRSGMRAIRQPVACSLVSLAALVPVAFAAQAGVPLLILDTDYRSDCDDAGALAVAHRLEDLDKVRLIGVVASTTGPHVVGAIDAVNTYYGRPDVPVGLVAGREGLDTARGGDDFAPLLANTRLFVSKQTNATAPDSTELYRRLLRDAPERSVKIVVVGGQTAIYGLMQSGANHNGDGIGLTGGELIEQKVSELVLMAGNFADRNHGEWNVVLDVEAAQQVARHWPTPIVYSGYEVGRTIMTGAALTDPKTNPVARAYEAYGGTTGGRGVIGDRNSWDQTAVLYAVAGTAWEGRELWRLSDPHEIDFDGGGRTRATASADADRRHLIKVMSDRDIASIISELMIAPPRNAGPRPQPHKPVGTLAHWRFDDGQGGALSDRGGRRVGGVLRKFENTAAAAGDDTPSGWTSDGRLRFDGADDYVETELALNALGAGGFTVEAVVRYAGPASRGWTPVLGSSHGPNYSATEIFYIGKQEGRDELNINLAGLAQFQAAAGGLFDGTERHLAVVFDSDAAEIRVFVDRKLLHTRRNVAGSFTGSSRLLIGATGHAANERWAGWISEVRLTDAALEPERFIP